MLRHLHLGTGRGMRADVLAAGIQTPLLQKLAARTRAGARRGDAALPRDPRFAFSGISVGGRHASVVTLHNITKTVLGAADNFLAESTPGRLAALQRGDDATND